jgi:hypothetical protein
MELQCVAEIDSQKCGHIVCITCNPDDDIYCEARVEFNAYFEARVEFNAYFAEIDSCSMIECISCNPDDDIYYEVRVSADNRLPNQ